MDSSFLLAILISFLTILLIYKFLKKSKVVLPPGPRGLPILGYLPFIKTNLHIQIDEFARKYGPIYKFWLGSKLVVVVNSPSLIKEVVRDKDAIFANHDAMASGIAATAGGINIVHSDYGPYWRHLRKLLARDMLSNHNLEASYGLRKDEVRKSTKYVYGKIGKAIDVGELIFVTEFNVIMSLMWGGTISEEAARDRIGKEFREKVSKLVELLARPNVSDYFPCLARFDLQGIVKEMKGVVPGIEETLTYVINKRKEMMMMLRNRNGNGNGNGNVVEGDHQKSVSSTSTKRKDFLEILLELTDEKAEQPMNVTQIRVFLTDIVVAGTDTTATIIEWVMAELLRNPDVMNRVQQELDDVVGINNIVEESDISKLVYLDAVLKEGFRLHPPLPFVLSRRPSQTVTLGGYTIPKGTKVLLNAWSTLRDPHVWDNPSEFKPERFLNDHDHKWDYSGHNFQYLPFGSGRRICPGLPLAEKMVLYMIATMLHSFDWKLQVGDELDMSEKFGIVMRKEKPLFAIPYQRLPHSNLYQ